MGPYPLLYSLEGPAPSHEKKLCTPDFPCKANILNGLDSILTTSSTTTIIRHVIIKRLLAKWLALRNRFGSIGKNMSAEEEMALLAFFIDKCERT